VSGYSSVDSIHGGESQLLTQKPCLEPQRITSPHWDSKPSSLSGMKTQVRIGVEYSPHSLQILINREDFLKRRK